MLNQMEAEHVPEYFVLPLWSSYTSTVKCSITKNEDEKLNEVTGFKTNKEVVDQEDQAFLEELKKLKRQEKEANDAATTLRKTFSQNTKDLLLQEGAARASSTNYVNTVNTPVNTASTLVKTASLSRNIPSLEDIYAVLNYMIFTSASYDAKGAVVDFINLESFMNVSPIPQSRIHSIHPTTQILGDPNSKIEPKKISQALEDESWVDAMQEELLQFKTYEVWILVDLPFRKKMGVKIAFLYGKIDEEVYVTQPSGFIDPKFPKKVYKVVKALYRRGIIDKTLFIKKDQKDIMLMSSMGELTFFLGLQVKQKKDGVFISHEKYVAEILKKFDFMSVNTASSPIKTKKSLVKDAEAADVDVHLYRSMIGSLMYLTASRPDIIFMIGSLMYLTASRPDIMYAVCACSRFQVTPKTSHLQAMKWIFRYLKCQPNLVFGIL
nr:hypothetical protein [Tanacetum cinerariifolium]